MNGLAQFLPRTSDQHLRVQRAGQDSESSAEEQGMRKKDDSQVWSGPGDIWVVVARDQTYRVTKARVKLYD